jgi:hypothetical protein
MTFLRTLLTFGVGGGFLCALAIASAQGPQWRITYHVSGQFDRQEWQLNASNDAVLKQPTVLPITSPPAGQTTAPNAFLYVVSCYVPPKPGVPEHYMGGEIKGLMKVRTVVQWIGAGSAPAAVKVAISAASTVRGSANTTRSAKNGLLHPQNDLTGPPLTTQSRGTRYREFKVAAGTVEFETTVTGGANIALSAGGADARLEYSVTVSNWAVEARYTRDTYRREVDANGFGIAVLNGPVGDGLVYADTIAPMTTGPTPFDPPGPMILTGAFSGRLVGPWTTFFSQWAWTLGGITPSFPTPALFGYLPDAPTTVSFTKNEGNTLTVNLLDTVTGKLWARDPVNQIEDDCTCVVRVHQVRENITKVRDHVKTGSPYLHSDEDPDIRSAFMFHEIARSPENLGGTGQNRTFTVTSTRSFTEGWQKEQNAGAEFGLQEVITLKAIFGFNWVENGLSSVGYTVGQTISEWIPAGHQVHYYLVFSGVASDWRVSKWGVSGYKGDGINVIVSEPSPDIAILPLPVGVEWDGRWPR